MVLQYEKSILGPSPHLRWTVINVLYAKTLAQVYTFKSTVIFTHISSRRTLNKKFYFKNNDLKVTVLDRHADTATFKSLTEQDRLTKLNS